MNKYQVKFSSEFKKSLKKIIMQGKDINKPLYIVDMLSKKDSLNSKYHDHALKNDKRFNNCRDCHIELDWILIYKYIDKEKVLLLVNTCSHSEVLDK